MVSFQVLYQTKLMLTAVLSVLFLGKRLVHPQVRARAPGHTHTHKSPTLVF